MVFGFFKSAASDKLNNTAFIAKLKNKEFREGAGAACALVATSGDGNVGKLEYQRYNDLCENVGALAHFDKDTLHAEFDKFVRKVKFSPREVWAELDQVPAEQRPSIIDVMVSMAQGENGIDVHEAEIILQAIDRYRLNQADWPALKKVV